MSDQVVSQGEPESNQAASGDQPAPSETPTAPQSIDAQAEPVNWRAIGGEITEILQGQLSDLVEAAEGDVRSFAREIAKTILTAIKKDKPHLVDECRDQLRALAEIHRIRFVGAGIVIADKVMTTAASVGLSLARRFLGGI